MTRIPFKISARTAKLIGRENFSNPEGAIIELVKNSYDADAKDCFVIFDIVFDNIPTILSISEFEIHSKSNTALIGSYKLQAKNYHLKSELDQERLSKLQDHFFGENSIYIIDNGHGMSPDIVQNQWMEIGTSNKEEIFLSDDGRIKTGAKGIGRFALDRLGYIAEMWTTPANKRAKGSFWKMDWTQFDLANKSLLDVEADIEEKQMTLEQLLQEFFKGKKSILNNLFAKSFLSGTIIKISKLKDIWQENNLYSVFKSLEALVPPKELAIPFNVNLQLLQDPKLFGQVETAYFNDFDYKVDATFDAKNYIVSLMIERDELDTNVLKNNYAHIFKGTKVPYDLNTVIGKKFKASKSVYELLSWEKNNKNSSLIKNLGNFSFSFYYLKNTNQKDYPYRLFNSAERQSVLKKFGGIKIYRDSFRVRPYGDIGNDWLKLGDRSAQSPAGAGQRVGDWRVGPNQIAGLVKISRINNPNLADKSDRGALIENETFDILKKILTEIINVFEVDRSIILHPFFLETKAKEKKERENEIKIEAVKLADKIFKERVKAADKSKNNTSGGFTSIQDNKEKESYTRIIEKGFQNIDKPKEDEAEISQIRTLASLGLIVSSFAHELKEAKNNFDDIIKLDKIFNKIVPIDKKRTHDFTDGVNIIEQLKEENQKIAHWVDYSLTAIKKDKRKRGKINLHKYFENLYKTWKLVLIARNIEFNYKIDISKIYELRAFEMDLDTLFNNLISNSIDSFNNLTKIRIRKVSIVCHLLKNNLNILYSDNGTGIPKVFKKNKDEIFRPFTTSKKDSDGNDIGTGLGMYLAKNVVMDNGGDLEIMDPSIGFTIKITLPIRNK